MVWNAIKKLFVRPSQPIRVYWTVDIHTLDGALDRMNELAEADDVFVVYTKEGIAGDNVGRVRAHVPNNTILAEVIGADAPIKDPNIGVYSFGRDDPLRFSIDAAMKLAKSDIERGITTFWLHGCNPVDQIEFVMRLRSDGGIGRHASLKN